MLAATEIYVGLTTERADRPPFSDDDAAAELRRLEADGRARAARDPRRARRRRPRRAGGAHAQAAAEPGRAVPPRGRRAAARRARAHDAARSPIGSSSRPRPPTTTSSTSTPRSASRPGPPPRSGRCSTTSSARRLSHLGPWPTARWSASRPADRPTPHRQVAPAAGAWDQARRAASSPLSFRHACRTACCTTTSPGSSSTDSRSRISVSRPDRR